MGRVTQGRGFRRPALIGLVLAAGIGLSGGVGIGLGAQQRAGAVIAPTLVSPKDGAEDQARFPTFEWRISPEADPDLTYVIVIDGVRENGGYYQGPCNDPDGCVFTAVSAFRQGPGPHTWKIGVVAAGSGGPSAPFATESAERSFSVGEGSSGPSGVSINDGDLYTNDANVELYVTPDDTTQQIWASNDGGFKEFKSFGLHSPIRWKLRSSGPERLPKIVYVRFLGPTNNNPQYSDDIILDETEPVVSQASLSGSSGSRLLRSGTKLRIRANDKTSGVKEMQIARRKSKPGKWQKFKQSVRVAGAPRKVLVRVADRAGNHSRWKTAK